MGGYLTEPFLTLILSGTDTEEESDEGATVFGNLSLDENKEVCISAFMEVPARRFIRFAITAMPVGYTCYIRVTARTIGRPAVFGM